MIDYKYSALFTKNSVDKQLTIKTDDESLVITNLELNQENFELIESICSESELKFGCCEASSVKFRISDVRTSLKDKWLTITEVLDGNSDTPFQFGRYKVFSDKPTADKRFRDIVAYDAMYDIINADVAEWYNMILPTVDSTVTMLEFRTSFISYFGLEQEDVSLANDNMIVEKTIDAQQISGKDIISAICELNGCFGHIGRDGKFKYIVLVKKEEELYPSDDLFPADDLYIPKSTAINLGSGSYISCQYEDYVASKITKLQIRQEENDIGAIVGDDGNCYIVEDNFLVYGKSADELEEIATNLLGVIEGICFSPFSADLKGNPCYEVGDYIRFRTKYRIVESYILKRTLSGIQALRDTYEADGEEYYTEKVNSVEKSIIQLKERTNKLTRSVDETKSEISKIETETKKYAEDVANNAENNANTSTDNKLKSYSTTTQMNSAITQKADSILSTVNEQITETKEYADQAASTAQSNANTNTANLLKNYSTTTQMNSAIEQKANSITSTVNKQITETKTYAETVASNAEANANAETTEKLKSYSTTTEMNTAIQQNADSITSTVSQSQTKWLIEEESLWVDIYGYGTPANATASEYKGKHYLDMETGQVYGTVTSGEGNIVWTLFGECKKLQEDIYSKIEQNAYGITQRVVRGEVVSEINQSADTIELKGDRIIVESTNWTVSEDGSQTCSDLTITGGNIDMYTSSDSAIAVEGDIYRSQIGAGGISVFRPNWNRKTEHLATGFHVYNDSGERVTDITGAVSGQITTSGNVYAKGYIWAVGDLITEGAKPRLVTTENYGKRLLYCYEVPSPMFGDIGEGQIDETGKCYIFLDDIFSETIDTDCTYQVFLQPYGKGECYVTERTSSYFIVEGTENLSFGWELKAIQRDFDTIRMEERERVIEQEESTVAETEAYLNSIVYGEDTVADTEEYLESLVYYEESEE